MVLGLVEHLYKAYFPSAYTTQVVAVLAGLYTLRTLSRGRSTSRDRTLHARTVILSSPFASSLGVTLLHELASRGATVICLSDRVGEAQDALVSALREEHGNASIFVEACDLTSPRSIHAFVAQFLKKENTQSRIDAIIYTHEYAHLGSFFSASSDSSTTWMHQQTQTERDRRSLGAFLLTTLLLPSLLVAPSERDIRIINVVNPFYAAATKSPFTLHFPSFSSTSLPGHPLPTRSPGVVLLEGARSLRSIIFSRHLQRILDALPNAHAPKATEGSSSVPVPKPESQKSNIVSISACPGFSRHDTLSPFFSGSWIGTIISILLFPFIWLVTKPSSSAVQTVLHALFLPTPFKIIAGRTDVTSSGTTGATASSGVDTQKTTSPTRTDEATDEALKAGALYRECAVVSIPIGIPVPPSTPEEEGNGRAKRDKGKGKETETLDLPDDGEYGGEAVGRHVWEAYEAALKVWEADEKATEAQTKEDVSLGS